MYTSFVDQNENKKAIDKAKEIIYVQLKTLLEVKSMQDERDKHDKHNR